MWIVSNEDKAVASTWGASVYLIANEPKQVASDLGLLCLQAGCTEVKDGEKTVKAEPVIEEAVKVVEEVSIDLEAMTKVQLEEYGRTLGIELDRRKKKTDLIAELEAAQ